MAVVSAGLGADPSCTPGNYTWGSVNKTTGLWSGGVGMIQRDEADYAIRGFGGTHARSKVMR